MVTEVSPHAYDYGTDMHWTTVSALSDSVATVHV